VVLPGVGAFADAMDSLSKSGMIEVIQKVIDSGKPFLGICLGMQLLFEYSEEGGQNKKGLGILKGAIKQLPFGMNLKVPHMDGIVWSLKTSLCCLTGFPKNRMFILFTLITSTLMMKTLSLQKTNYGINFSVAVQKQNVFATQFHPEKSGEVGLKILKNFAGIIF